MPTLKVIKCSGTPIDRNVLLHAKIKKMIYKHGKGMTVPQVLGILECVKSEILWTKHD